MTDRQKADKLLAYVQGFIKEHEISHEEAIQQSDTLQLAGSEFMEACCEIAGYHEYKDEP